MIRTLLLSAAALPLFAAQSAIRSDGVMLVDGRPFVPLGIYYNNLHRGPSLVAADMQAIAATGFNCVETSQIQGWAQPDAGLDAVRAAGLRAFLEAWWQRSETAAWVAARTGRSEIVGWNLADDSHRRFTIEQMATMEASARAAAPGQILYQSVYQSADMGPYLDFTDTVWGYRYPTYNQSEGSSQSAVGSVVMRPLEASGTPFMAIPQAYRWDDDATYTGNRFPTIKEYRCQAWQALVCGAKGLIPYSMTDTTGAPWLPTAAPALWQEVGATAHEVRDLRWVIADGARSSLTTTGDDPYWFYGAVWSWRGSRLIAITNASSSSRAVSTTISGAPGGSLTSLRMSPASAWNWNGVTLSGTLAPAETCLFRIGSLDNAPPVVAVTAPAIPANGSGTLTLATDANENALTVTIVRGPLHGRLTGSGAVRTYQPNPGYTGPDSVQVAVHDGWNDASGTVAFTVAANNAAPTVALTRPTAGTGFTAPATVSLAANAADADGSVAKVEFFQGSTRLGEDASAPYTFAWTGIAAGSYSLTARATDNTGAVTTSAVVAITVSAAVGPLPSGWAGLDVGAPALAGSATHSNGTYTLVAAGSDIWNTSDQFRFVHRRLSGDGQIIARVTSLTNPDQWAKAGVMIRESTAAGARHALTAVTPMNGMAFQRRQSTNGPSSHTAGSRSAAPVWVRLTRVGSLFTSSESSDGVTWRVIGSSTITMDLDVDIGLVLTSHNPGARATASITNITVTGAIPGNG